MDNTRITLHGVWVFSGLVASLICGSWWPIFAVMLCVAGIEAVLASLHK